MKPAEREWIRVRCHEGRRYRERPLAVEVEGAEDEIELVLDQWIEQSAGSARTRYFRVKLVSGRVYVIAHETTAGRWFLHAVVPGARPRES